MVQKSPVLKAHVFSPLQTSDQAKAMLNARALIQEVGAENVLWQFGFNNASDEKSGNFKLPADASFTVTSDQPHNWFKFLSNYYPFGSDFTREGGRNYDVV